MTPPRSETIRKTTAPGKVLRRLQSNMLQDNLLRTRGATLKRKATVAANRRLDRVVEYAQVPVFEEASRTCERQEADEIDDN